MRKFLEMVWRTCGQCDGNGCKWCNWKGGIDTGHHQH